MSFSLRTTILATGCILAIGTSAARAQMPRVFYYPAPGQLRHDAGTVNIPAAGYYYNVPLYAVPAPASPAPARGLPTPKPPSPIIPVVALPRRAAAAGMRAATNAPAARMLVATTRTTRTVKPSRRKPMHRIPRSYSPLLAWDAPRCPYGSSSGNIE